MGLNIEVSDANSDGNRTITANGVKLGTISILWNNMLWSICLYLHYTIKPGLSRNYHQD